MLTISRIIPILLSVVCFLLSPLCSSAFAVENTIEGDIVSVIKEIRICHRTYPTPVDNVRDVYTRLTEMTSSIEKALSEPLLIYKAICLVMLGEKEDAEEVIKEGLEMEIDVPEFLQCKVRVVGGDGADIEASREARWEVMDELGGILPLSSHGRSRDRRASQHRGDVYVLTNPPRPFTPRTRPEILIRIGELFEEMGFVQTAIDTYVEAFYLGGTLHDDGGELWLRIADLELKYGDNNLALRAYLKAAYWSYSSRERAEKGIRLSLGKSEQKDSLPGKYDVGKVRQIADLYAELNMHPLGMSVLRRAGKILEVDLTEDENRLSSDWDKIVEKISFNFGGECYIYGHDASKVDDWATIEILRPSDTFWKPAGRTAGE